MSLRGGPVLSRRLGDPDIAQVELLARLDGEFLADLRADLAADDHGVIDEAIRRAGDQDGERDPAVGIGGRRRRVVDRVDLVQAASSAESSLVALSCGKL